MTSRAQLVLNTHEVRQTARRWIDSLPAGTRVEFKGPRRSIEQNDRMWAMLTDIARQKLLNGTRYTTDQWKVMFLHLCGRELCFLPSLSGAGMIPYGQSSSDLSVSEMTDLIECMFAWGAENEVAWSDPTQQRDMERTCA